MKNSNLYFSPWRTEKHEVIRFDHRPKDPAFTEALMQYYRRIALLADLTASHQTESRLQLNITTTVDGKSFCSEDPDDLYEGISAMEDAESVAVDAQIEGVVNNFCIHMRTSKSGRILDELTLENGQDIDDILDTFVGREDFDYSCVEYIPDVGEIGAYMIRNGEWKDCRKDFHKKSSITEDSHWWCLYLSAYIPNEAISKETKEQLKEIVLRGTMDSDHSYTIECWEDAEEDTEQDWPILSGVEWDGDLCALESFLNEINSALGDAASKAYVDTNYNRLINMPRLGFAELMVDETGLHVKGTAL